MVFDVQEKAKRPNRGIWLTLAVLWLLFIWGNSLQTAAESSEVSRGVMAYLIPLLEWTGLPEGLWHTLVRKLAHMTEFALLGMLWSLAVSPGAKTTPHVRWTRRSWALLICLGAALIDESIQRFVPGRSGELRDVCIDLLGGILGILAVLAAAAVRKRLKNRRKV